MQEFMTLHNKAMYGKKLQEEIQDMKFKEQNKEKQESCSQEINVYCKQKDKQ